MATRLFWWKAKPNFGDSICKDIVAFVSGGDVEWSYPKDADLFGVGSIMQFVRRHFVNNGESRATVWGSGVMKPMDQDFVSHTDFAAVRGPITREFLGLNVDVYGDPGLLMPFVLQEKIQQTGKIGIVPHFQQLPRVAKLLEKFGDDVVLISPQQDNHLDVVRQIASCSTVFSSSLHGLVIADAYGIPNVWLNPMGIHPHAQLKFYDYAAGVMRPMPKPVAAEDIPTIIKNGVPPITYGDSVKETQRAIFEAFPEKFKGANAPEFDPNWYDFTHYSKPDAL